MKGIAWVLSCCAVLAACYAPMLLRDAVAAASPALEELKNLQYQGLDGEPIQLRNGMFEGAPLAPKSAARLKLHLADELVAAGDLDGDGIPDNAVLLIKTSGGSGELTYLAIVTRPEGLAKNTATVLLGDRVQIRSLDVTQGLVTLTLVTAGPGEPACCPATKTTRTFAFAGSEFKETGSLSQGKLSVQDLVGVTWKLASLGLEAPPVAESRATLVFQSGRISGSGGCNHYFARIEAGDAGEISVGPVGATEMACPGALMQLEGAFLRKLEKVRKFGFRLGKLALTYEADGASDVLLFVPELPVSAPQ